MNTEKILVTSARGRTGFAVAQACLKLGLPVRAFVRSKDGPAAELAKLGAELFVGDQMDIRDLRQSMKGVRKAYFCPPVAPFGGLHSAAVFAIAAEEAHLEHVVAMTQWLALESHKSVITREHWLTDQLLQWSPTVKYTYLRPGLFADMYFMVLEPMAQLGLMPMPLGAGLNAPPSNEDMGRVVAHILRNPAGHEGKTYRPTGPELLSPQDIANVVGGVLGRKIRYVDIPKWMFLRAMNMPKYPIFQISQLQYYVQDNQKNAFGIGGPTNVVKAITGQEAESFETTARRYVANRPEAKKSILNKVKALIEFAKIPLRRPVNTDKYESLAGHPRLKNAELAPENEEWVKSRVSKSAWTVDVQEEAAISQPIAQRSVSTG